ncbi:MAG: alpha/beta hydrolase [Candidatus Shapirobacteria bacterium]|nr:alpha/beta hydrolase [Candidatus Shapirobacteria bacterium]
MRLRVFVKITARMTINFQEFGKGRQKIIFLHGWQQNSKSFLSLVPFLYRQFKLYFLDLPGFGKTPLSTNLSSSTDYARLISRWLQKKQINKPVVVGHSFGGKVAALLASQCPQELEKLILIAPAGIPHPRWWYPLSAKIPPKIKQKLEPITKIVFTSRDFKEAGPLQPILANIVKEDLRSVFANIHAPTLIIWGKTDQELPLTDGQEINRLIPNSQLKIIPAGHFPFWDQPKKAAQIISRFIAR